MDIGRYAEVGALYRDKAEEVGGQRGRIRVFGARGEGKRKVGVPSGSHCELNLRRKSGKCSCL